MKKKQVFLGAGTLVAIAAFAFAHHVPVGLSHVFGPEILREVTFFTSTGVFGVPSHRVGQAELPDHGAPVGLADGDSFSVMDQNGAIETVTFLASDFVDIALADTHDVVHEINDQVTLFEAVEHNGYLVLRGKQGGSLASLTVSDGAGGPLNKLGMGGGVVFGRDNLELTLSIPDPNLNLAGRNYIVLVSATNGAIPFGRRTIPIGADGLTMPFLNAAVNGLVTGFAGQLDANSDATALLTAAQLQQGFAGTYPDKLYFAFVVFGTRPGTLEYVSNQFVVDFQ